MKLTSRFVITAFVFAGLCASGNAQDPAGKPAEKLIDFKKVEVQVQKTPEFNLKSATKDKRVTPKDWLEIEPEFKTIRPQDAKKAEVISELTFKYYVYLNSSVKENARILTAEVVHINVPIDVVTHSVVYISPSSVLKVTGKAEGNPLLVIAYAVEVTSGGTVVGYISKAGSSTVDNPKDPKGRWWELKTAPPMEPVLLAKPQTPFSPLWADYHADVKAK